MFQKHALFPWLAAGKNIALALKLRGIAKPERRAEVERLLELVRLQGAHGKRVHELSGGMRQRVALARALAQDSRLLLMDEAFAALDAITHDVLHDELTRIFHETGLSVLLVTHNVREAVKPAQRVVLLSSRPGRIAREWTVGIPQPRRIEDSGVAEQLLVRVRLRLRLREADSTVLRRAGIALETRTRQAYVDGRIIQLSSREAALLEHLMRNTGTVVTWEYLLSDVWGTRRRRAPTSSTCTSVTCAASWARPGSPRCGGRTTGWRATNTRDGSRRRDPPNPAVVTPVRSHRRMLGDAGEGLRPRDAGTRPRPAGTRRGQAP